MRCGRHKPVTIRLHWPWPRPLSPATPGDFTAHIVASRSYRDLGQADAALAEALTASKLASNDAERFTSSLLVAQALSTAERRFEAQLWLRWAANQAPNERARAVAMRDFRYVRSRNPVKLDFSFNVAPSNNINNGSSADLVTIFGLPAVLSGDAKALSGTRISTGAELTWRFPATERKRARAALSFYHQTHILSDEAQVQAPLAEDEDFDYTSLTASYRQDLNFGAGTGLWGWKVSAGRSWYGGDPLSDFVALGLDRTIALEGVGNLTVATGIQHQVYVDGSGVDATAVSLSAAVNRAARRRGAGEA